jgi:hypothetical protein
MCHRIENDRVPDDGPWDKEEVCLCLQADTVFVNRDDGSHQCLINAHRPPGVATNADVYLVTYDKSARHVTPRSGNASGIPGQPEN